MILVTILNIRHGYNSKKVVTFDMQDRLDDKIDKLTSMMSKLTVQDSNQNIEWYFPSGDMLRTSIQNMKESEGRANT